MFSKFNRDGGILKHLKKMQNRENETSDQRLKFLQKRTRAVTARRQFWTFNGHCYLLYMS
jgi:hypothetical protein